MLDKGVATRKAFDAGVGCHFAKKCACSATDVEDTLVVFNLSAGDGVCGGTVAVVVGAVIFTQIVGYACDL